MPVKQSSEIRQSHSPGPLPPLPFISCLCPTANRRRMLRRAIECFLWQTYPSDHRELVILDDGADRVESVVTTVGGMNSSIRYFFEEPTRLLGPKRNRLVELARGDLLVLWDDDDWHGPERLAAQARALTHAALCTLDRVRVQDTQGVVWEQPHGGWTFPGTAAFRRSVWIDRPFPDQGMGADLDFIQRPTATASIDGTRLYRVIRHDDQARDPSFESTGWIRRKDLRTINVEGGL